MMRRTIPLLAAFVFALAVILPACGGEDDAQEVDARLGNQFQATADRPYSFRYPTEWVIGEESEGELALGIEDSVGMVLEPIHAWGGPISFAGEDVDRIEIDGYVAYRMPLGGDGEEGQGLGYRIDADGVDVTVWFFARLSADYDEDLFEAIMSTFRFDVDLLRQ